MNHHCGSWYSYIVDNSARIKLFYKSPNAVDNVGWLKVKVQLISTYACDLGLLLLGEQLPST